MKNKSLYAICVLFLAPLLLACLFYFMRYTPGSTQRGHLIIPVQQANFITEQKRQWTWVFVCKAQCENDLKTLDTVWQLMGANRSRITPLILSSKKITTPGMQWYNSQSLPLSVQKVQNKYPNAFLFIIDPLHNLMMAYDTPTWAKDLLFDMKKLLHASQIG